MSDTSPTPRDCSELDLVFVNDDRIICTWRWEKADADDPTLPQNHEARFDERKV